MSAAALSQLLLLYSWFVLAALLTFLLLVARFYQKFSGERTYYKLYIVPILLYGTASVRYAVIDRIGGDLWGDLLTGAAGVMLGALVILLYRLMTSGRKPL